MTAPPPPRSFYLPALSTVSPQQFTHLSSDFIPQVPVPTEVAARVSCDSSWSPVGLQVLEQQFALWPRFSKGSKKSCWFFSLFSFFLTCWTRNWKLVHEIFALMATKSLSIYVSYWVGQAAPLGVQAVLCLCPPSCPAALDMLVCAWLCVCACTHVCACICVHVHLMSLLRVALSSSLTPV